SWPLRRRCTRPQWRSVPANCTTRKRRYGKGATCRVVSLLYATTMGRRHQWLPSTIGRTIPHAAYRSPAPSTTGRLALTVYPTRGDDTLGVPFRLYFISLSIRFKIVLSPAPFQRILLDAPRAWPDSRGQGCTASMGWALDASG